LPGKTRLQNDLKCVKRDVKLYSLTHSEAPLNSCPVASRPGSLICSSCLTILTTNRHLLDGNDDNYMCVCVHAYGTSEPMTWHRKVANPWHSKPTTSWVFSEKYRYVMGVVVLYVRPYVYVCCKWAFEWH